MSGPIKAWIDQQHRAADGAARRRDVLAALLDEHGPMTLREMGRKSGIDLTTIAADMRFFAREGVVSKQGREFKLVEDAA